MLDKFYLGAAIDFTGIDLPFNVSDLMSSSMALIGLVSVFILLGMAFGFAPKIISLIKGSING